MHKNPYMAPNMSLTNWVHTLPIKHAAKWSLSFMFSNKTCVQISSLTPT